MGGHRFPWGIDSLMSGPSSAFALQAQAGGAQAVLGAVRRADGLGLLPKDLLADAAQAKTNVAALIAAAVTAYQETRARRRPPRPQPARGSQLMTTVSATSMMPFPDPVTRPL